MRGLERGGVPVRSAAALPSRLFVGGLSAEETAAVLEVSTKTVIRDWTFAKAWLQREMAAEVRVR